MNAYDGPRGLDYDPFEHADQLGVTWSTEQRGGLVLRRTWWGAYDHPKRHIYLADDATERNARWAMAHEVQHAIAGDVGLPPGPELDSQEWRANVRAAHLLIDALQYTAAALLERHLSGQARDRAGRRIRSCDWNVALHLNVPVRTILVWQQWHATAARERRP